MLDELTKVLNSDELYIKQYNISKETDLFNDKIINFYYLLFKYILNNSFYVFQINFLNNIRNNILKIMKKNKEIYLKEEIKNKLEFVLNIIIDSKYYMKKYIKEKIETLSNFFNKNSELSTKTFTNNVNNKESDNKNEYNTLDIFRVAILTHSSFLFIKNKNGKFIFVLYEYNKVEQIKENNNEKINNLDENFEQFLKYLYLFKKLIIEEFELHYNLIIKLDFNKETSEINNDLFSNISGKYTFYPPYSNRIYSFEDDNILNNVTNSYSNGLNYLIDKINDSDYKYISFKININVLKTIKEKDLIKNKEESKSKNIFTLLEIGNLSGVSEYNIINFKKVIGKHESAEFLLSLSNGFFISGGNCKDFIIYNQNLKKEKT